MNKEHNQEDLWDYICSQVGFDKEGKEIQKAIKLFNTQRLNSQLKELVDELENIAIDKSLDQAISIIKSKIR